MSKRKYYVKTGNMYFQYFEESQYPVFVIDDNLEAKEEASEFYKQSALILAKQMGAEIEPVEKLYQMPVPYLEKMGGYWGYRKAGDNRIVLEDCKSITEHNAFTWDEIMEYFPSIAEFAVEVEE
ncbi:hypothetical protein [Tetragenococcus halophilus]|uniref:hypothetical protein n=1 Tax=Tetragenococcus halophilus TaxID=51669 RepID=UPI002A99EACC|nr:hypothetical protein TEHSL10_11720 [Tetragenococcus halophilus]